MTLNLSTFSAPTRRPAGVSASVEVAKESSDDVRLPASSLSIIHAWYVTQSTSSEVLLRQKVSVGRN